MARRDCDAACGSRCGLTGGATCATARDRCNDACRPPCATDAGTTPDPNGRDAFCDEYCARAEAAPDCGDFLPDCRASCEQFYAALNCESPQRAAVVSCFRMRTQTTGCAVPPDAPEAGLQPVIDWDRCDAELRACGL